MAHEMFTLAEGKVHNTNGPAPPFTYTVERGDDLDSPVYAPTETQFPDLPAGGTYNVLRLRHPDGGNASCWMNYTAISPAWAEILKNINTKVDSSSGSFTLQPGDSFNATTGRDTHLIGMTFNFWRGNESLGEFSILFPDKPPMPS